MSTPTYEDVALAAEAIVNGHVCPECGRSDDWLCEGVRGQNVVLSCNNCAEASIGFSTFRMPEHFQEALDLLGRM